MKRFQASLIAVTALIQLTSCVNPSRGLVAHYPLDGNAVDIGPNKLHGTVHGARPAPDRNNTPNAAFYFDGNSYVEVPDDTLLNFDNDFTLVAWINMVKAKKMGSRILDKQVGSSNYGFLLDTYQQDGFGTGVRLFVGESWIYKAKSRLALNEWHLIVGTYKDGVGKIYIDGELDSEASSSTIKKIVTSKTPMRIGFDTGISIGFDFDDSFVGRIDDVRIYRRVLSADEIRTLYKM